jgi:hypothetical protein
MSSNRGIEVRFTFPAGLHVTEHLRGFTSARARNMEIMRLAENALLAQKGVTLAPSVEQSGTQNANTESLTRNDSGEPTETVEEESEGNALASMNLMSIG